MNIFLSWSGERSKAVAELMNDWLQCVIQAVDPWMSSKDIDRGSLWFSEINDQLQNTTIGIICLTQENKNKPWILFEAGALAKGLSNSRVCTLLIDLEPTDVGTPLSQFNHTMPNQDSIWELVRTLNNSLKDKALREKTLEQVFSTYWPQFEQAFQRILTETPATAKVEKRSEDEILVEILSATRAMEKRVRSLESGNSNYFSKRNLFRENEKQRIQLRASDGKHYSFSYATIDSKVSNYMNEGLSLETIIEILSKEYDISESEMSKVVSQVI